MLKKHLPTVLASLLSALVAVTAYRLLEKPREVIIREPSESEYRSRNVSRDGLTTEGNASFSLAAPTEFTYAASVSTPAVVNIQSVNSGGRGLSFDKLFGRDRYPQRGASGSGVIISKDGYIVTNHHVVADGDKISVSFSDNREMKATLIGSDPSTDLALIKVEVENLPFLTFGNSDSVQIGEWVLAVGNPFDLESTVTAGIVSAKGRSIDVLDAQDKIESFIQTDAAVNPGNSGGALVNTSGELIGINTAILTQSGQYEGYSFAVPSNLVRKVIGDLKNYGIVQRGLIGIRIEDVNSELARNLGLNDVAGVHITGVTPGSGAADAGLRRDDVILRVNGVKTGSMPELQEQVGRYSPGNVLRVEYMRNGKKSIAKVTLKNRSNKTSIVQGADVKFLQKLGMEVRPLNAFELKQMELENGVKVTSVFKGSKIDQTNLKPNFVITQVNERKITSEEDLIAALRNGKTEVKLRGVYAGVEEPYFYVFDLK
ncbi:trypsin-like peptidase domain-containing protein [Haliscomenobacter hydrossis]|uniref:Protease Do n=1 Tax=Haliscomenobacter hydrossis (strain ATCC 27775 / DSM 1100 / LMG 10767 / O) TaxID=760192 RepID=F4KW73_HALH1|nr:trypsin-like peptidase domain-containing protein [Haliscomenobacter hydrossis]AEE49261.1 protease Do [Haliscomenobacter hydrossis DSM 1100]